MANRQKLPIAVIGAGVVGLTSAIRLLETGYKVIIYARAATPHTTSDVAAAYWAPGAALGAGRMRQWALTSLATFRALTEDAASGVRWNRLYELSDGPVSASLPPLPVPVEVTPPLLFPVPWAGICVTVPQIDVPIYMPWLLQRFLTLGGVLQPGELQRFEEVLGEHRLIVNCTGLGAQRLTGDELFPIRGQVIRVRKPAGLDPPMIYAEGAGEVTYIIPRAADCLLGGTYHYGDSRTELDEAIAAGILTRCAQFNASFASPEIIAHRVGLRPGRHSVRLAVEQLAQGAAVIHNYGHGAVGHTLSWGCAAEVSMLVDELAPS